MLPRRQKKGGEPAHTSCGSCCKSCCSLTFSTLGLLILVIAYSIGGGFLFMYIEKENEAELILTSRADVQQKQQVSVPRCGDCEASFSLSSTTLVGLTFHTSFLHFFTSFTFMRCRFFPTNGRWYNLSSVFSVCPLSSCPVGK